MEGEFNIMLYRPNVWLMSELDRRIASAACQLSEYNLSLRPTRRFIFVRNYKLKIHLPEFFKPCFGVLCEKNDPDKKPSLVIETEQISDELKYLYADHGILWSYIYKDENRYVLECNYKSTKIWVDEEAGNLFTLLSIPLALHEKHLSFPQGSFVHSFHERLLYDAVQSLSNCYRIQCHHQVPVSRVTGVVSRDILNREEENCIRNGEIDAVITRTYQDDPDYKVILPIKIDVHNTHRENWDTMKKDKNIKNTFERLGIPLLVITPGKNDTVQFDCPQLGLPIQLASRQDRNSWAKALAPFLGSALQRVS